MVRRRLVLAASALTAALVGAGILGSVAAPGGGGRSPSLLGGGARYFAVACGFSHRNQDDPIVFPGQPGRSHDHTYFGNRTTNAASTPASLRAAGRTTCRLAADTAAYWAPTLNVANQPVVPRGVVAYYIRRTIERVEPFPANLEVIAGNAAATTRQSLDVTSWSCGRRARSSTIPTCSGFSRLRLQINFPNCWDGQRLDSADHKSHMAYSSEGVCPASHAVEVPALTLVISYGVSGGDTAELSSGGDFSAHADFVNAWNQSTLTRLVNRYLNRSGRRR